MGTKAWYVSPSGNDGGPGTQASPFRTINKAGSVVNPGETIYVGAGGYKEIVSLPRSGTANQPITVANVANELAVVDGTGLNPSEGLFNILGAYVTVQGIVVQNSNKYGLENVGHHNTVRGCVIQRIQRAGLLTSDRGGNGANDHNLYDGNEVTQTCLQNLNNAMGTEGWDSAINGYHGGGGASGHNLYVNNRVHDNWGEGMTVMDDDIVWANRCWDNWSVNIYLDGKQRVVVERNLIWATEGTPYIAHGRRSIGIGFADERSPARLSDCNVRSNFILNCSTGIDFWNAGQAGSGLKNCKVFNNSVVNTVGNGVNFMAGDHTGAELRNNIIWPRAGNALSAPGVATSNNLVKGVNTDPGLPGEGSSTNFDPNAYKIPSGSSARNAGTNTGAPIDDYFGTARPQGGTVDIGAHEYI